MTGEQWEHDISNQRILERVGWVFWRCWAASYKLNPDACFDDLLAGLKANKLIPSEQNTPADTYTEFRQVSNVDEPLTLAPVEETSQEMVAEL